MIQNMTPLKAILRRQVRPLRGEGSDYDELMGLIGEARFVLLGEATHGSHEFYHERAEITRRLIMEKGFNAVAVEADWPDAYRVNRYVRGGNGSPVEALGDFKRFPQWMWRNRDVEHFVGWLRDFNSGRSEAEAVGFYGLDLYSLHASLEAVIRYLESVDPRAAQRARERYACFEHVGEDPQAYGYQAAYGLGQSCEDEAVAQIVELQREASDYLKRDGFVGEDEYFFAERNAAVARNAEQYYRLMFRGRASSWNLRDRHMAETLDALARHLGRRGQAAKIVVWEHNSHVGDARATQMSESGELTVGQLARQRYGRESVLIGFTTYRGTVSAASEWGGAVERKWVRRGLSGSYEALFHYVGVPSFMLNLRDASQAVDVLREPRLERAIGVLYLPETERLSHYFFARLTEQFDAVLHFDETTAVEPLERTAAWEQGEAPETQPTGL